MPSAVKTFNPAIFEKEFVEAQQKAFKEAHPYPHLVIDNFLSAEAADRAYQQFPTVQELKTHWKSLNENKLEGSDFDSFNPVFGEIDQALKTPEFYKWITDVTGIEEVFITNDSMGSGIHQGTNGSFLDIHIDFNIHHKLDVHRRLNLLIYLQKDWKDEFGGHLEMWDSKMTKCEKKVLPAFNRAVIFETSEISYHGYGKITIPEGVTRKSFFAYFYTKEREGAAAYHDTIFRARPEEGTGKRIKTMVKENLKNTAKSTLKKLGVKF